MSRQDQWKIIFYTGLIAAVLDGIAACALTYFLNGRGPEAVFKFIASGVFGAKAFAGGIFMTLSGVLFHLLIATIWAFLFFVIYPFLGRWIKNWIVLGITYGFIIWLLMNLVVVPLSNAPKLPFSIIGLLIIIACVGLPVSYLVGKFYSRYKVV